MIDYKYMLIKNIADKLKSEGFSQDVINFTKEISLELLEGKIVDKTIKS